MNIVVQRLVDTETQERENLANLVIPEISNSRIAVLGLEKVPIVIAKGKIIEISLGVMKSNGNMNLMVRYNESHMLTVACHWGEMAPCVAFLTPDKEWIELYFQNGGRETGSPTNQ